MTIIENAKDLGQEIYTKAEVDTSKQAALVSGTNIKTVGGASLLGSGDITVGGIPSGVITLWSGSSASIPSGWYLCNGANGTPNLMDRFVVGAGSSYPVGATGGSTSASVSGTTGATTLTTTQMPSHNHGGASFDSNSQGYSHDNSFTRSSYAYLISYSTGSTGGNGSHTHSMSGSVDTRSPYYALCYIMKA